MLNSSQCYFGSLTCQNKEPAILLLRLVFIFPFRLNSLALRQKKMKVTRHIWLKLHETLQCKPYFLQMRK